jgi:hypothetical protein
MEIVITNRHHFCNGIQITVTNNKVVQFIGRNGEDLTSPTTVDEFIRKVYAVFCMTGVDYSDYKRQRYLPQIEVGGVLQKDEERAQEIKDILYQQPLEIRANWIFICEDFVSSDELLTYGDVMRGLGTDYLDSVHLYIEEMKIETTPIDSLCECSERQQKIPRLDPDEKVIRAYYYR